MVKRLQTCRLQIDTGQYPEKKRGQY
jgi:hypothetical protein